MDRWNYDNTNSNGRGFAGPFLMGLAVGIAGAAVYAAARSGRLGTFMEEKVHGLEEGAGNIKNKVVEKAGSVKDAVVNRFGHGSTDNQMNRMGMGEEETAGAGRKKNSAA